MNRLSVCVGLTIAMASMVSGQEEAPPAESVESPVDVQIPLRVEPVETGGVRVLSYHGTDGLLKPGDLITRVGTPNSESFGVEVSTPKNFREAILAGMDERRKIALLVERGDDFSSVIVQVQKGPTLAVGRRLLVETRLTNGGVEVVSYEGTDGLLKPGDVILWVATPGTDDPPVEAYNFKSAVIDLEDDNHFIALWVQRPGNDPDWVIGTLTAPKQKKTPIEVAVSSLQWGPGQPSPDIRSRTWGLPFTVTEEQDGLKVVESQVTGLLPGDLIQNVQDRVTASKEPLITTSANLECFANARKDSSNSALIWATRNGKPIGDENGLIRIPVRITHLFSEETTCHINHTATSPYARLIPANWGQHDSGSIQPEPVVTVSESDPAITPFWRSFVTDWQKDNDIKEKLDSFDWVLRPDSTRSDAYRILYKNGHYLRDDNGTCVCQDSRGIRGAFNDDSDTLWLVTTGDYDSSRFMIRNLRTNRYLSFEAGSVKLVQEPFLTETEWQIGKTHPHRNTVSEIVSGNVYRLSPRARHDSLTTQYHPQPGINNAYDERSHWIIEQIEGTHYYNIINLDSGMALTAAIDDRAGARVVDWGRDSVVDMPRLTSQKTPPSVLPFTVEQTPDRTLRVVSSRTPEIHVGDIIIAVRQPRVARSSGDLQPGPLGFPTDRHGRDSSGVRTVHTPEELETAAITDRKHEYTRGERVGEAAFLGVQFVSQNPSRPSGWVRVALTVPDQLSPYRQQWELYYDRGTFRLRNRATGRQPSHFTTGGLTGQGLGEKGYQPVQWQIDEVGTADDVAVVRIEKIECVNPSTGIDGYTKILFSAIDSVAEKAILPAGGGPGFGSILKKSFSTAWKSGMKAGRDHLRKEFRAIITREYLVELAKEWGRDTAIRTNIMVAANRAQGKQSRFELLAQESPETILANLAIPAIFNPETSEMRTDDSISEALFSVAGGKDLPDQIYLKVDGVGVWPFKERSAEQMEALEGDGLWDMSRLAKDDFWKAFGAAVAGADKRGSYVDIARQEVKNVGIEFVFRKSKGVTLELMEWDVGKKSWDITPGVLGSDDDSLGTLKIPTMDLTSPEHIDGAILRNEEEGSFYTMTLSARPYRAPRDPWPGEYAGDERQGFAWCPPGSFLMGSPENEPGRGPDENQVNVTFSHGFWLGKHEVTQAEFLAIMGHTPNPIQAASLPVAGVTWDEANEFCRRLTNLQRDAGRLPAGWEYCLPTEAQWEYACRAGSTTAYSFGSDPQDFGRYTASVTYEDFEAGSVLRPVGSAKPNAWGLYDMQGNVTEWCRDVYREFNTGGTDPEVTDAHLAEAHAGVIARGSSFGEVADEITDSMRSSWRGAYTVRFPLERVPYGFRVAVAYSPQAELEPAKRYAGVRPGHERYFFDDARRREKGVFCWCPPGQFRMGYVGENNPMDVTLSQGFWIGKFEVTQQKYEALMGSNPSQTKDEHRSLPVQNVTWKDAVEFCYRLTVAEKAAGRLPPGWKYQLPSDAQWEYACRAGTKTTYFFGDNAQELPNYAWFDGSSQGELHEVGSRRSNAWNICDMHGNLFEWCRDQFRDDLPGGTDPVRIEPIEYRYQHADGSYSVRQPPQAVFRGGAFDSPAAYCASGFRAGTFSDTGIEQVGFRVALVPENDEDLDDWKETAEIP